MNTIRISETINSHDLVIPFELLKLLNHQEVEILVFPRKTEVICKPKAKKLLEIFERYLNIEPFSEILDGVAWQKEVRGEW